MLEIIGAGIGHVAQRDFALDYQQSSLAQRNRMSNSNLVAWHISINSTCVEAMHWNCK
jgi:hypothetical protein